MPVRPGWSSGWSPASKGPSCDGDPGGSPGLSLLWATASHCVVPLVLLVPLGASPFLTGAVVVVRRAGKGGGHALPAVGGRVDVSWAGGPSLSEVQVLVDVLGEEVGHEPGRQLSKPVAQVSSSQVGQ